MRLKCGFYRQFLFILLKRVYKEKFMYKLTNIAAEVGKGYLYHSHTTNHSPSSCGLHIEPHIGSIQLKLYESYTITDEMYSQNKKYFEELITNRIIEAIQTVVDKQISNEDIVLESVEAPKIIVQPLDIEPDNKEEEKMLEEAKDLQLEISVQKKPIGLVKKKGK